LAITDDVADSGNQRPVELIAYTRALANGSQTYTAGINLFWIDLQWSATPGVPLRATAIDQMARSTFRSPCQTNDVHIAVAYVSFNPLMHKGGVVAGLP
jgi:hypothetical protein